MLVTPDEWGNYTTATAPANAETLLEASSQQIIDYCGWGIAREVVTDLELDSDGGWVLRLPTLHLVSVEQVKVDDVPVTDFTRSLKGMLDRRPACWPVGFGRIAASFTHGYEPVPANIKALAVGLAIRGPQTTQGLKSETVGRMQRVWQEGATQDDLSGLDRLALAAYRLERI